MHDIDRTLTEFEADGDFESDFESEFEGDNEPEFEDEFEYEDEDDAFGELEYESAAFGDASRVLSDAEEMEMASDLLSVTNDAELEQFLGKLFKKVTRKVGRFMKSGVGRRIGGFIKGIAKKALPVLGGALGSAIPIPGIGTALGSALGGAAGKMFGLELEGLSPEDQEFEAAKRVVRLATTAAANAAKASKTPASPAKIAKVAIVKAIQKHAPGIVKRSGYGSYGPSAGHRGHRITPRGRTGRWVRRGRYIILIGA